MIAEHIDIKAINKKIVGKSPQEIVFWALKTFDRPVITTNFRPYEASILHLTSTQKQDLPVIWCDTGYNTVNTYRHAQEIIKRFNLNLYIYVPQQTTAYRDVVMGIPAIDDPMHREFTEQVKLEPFRRAMDEHKPDIWFTNLRKGQTQYRDEIGIVSKSSTGIVKVSPFYNYTDEQLDDYNKQHDIPNEFKYFDPTKSLANRECGLHG